MPRKARTASLADAHAATGGVAAVDRALSLLNAFRPGDDALGLAELASRTGLYKSTVLRLLASLEHARLLQRLGDGRYGLGGQVARLHTLYAASFSLDRVVLPVLRELVANTGESAAYHVRQGRAPKSRSRSTRSRLLLSAITSTLGTPATRGLRCRFRSARATSVRASSRR